MQNVVSTQPSFPAEEAMIDLTLIGMSYESKKNDHI